ncbi:MAG: hypothetical protein K8S97_02530 [Anaerolineae bacterium]|nr:hypothetical protein [Anaerolineae bacterium]
MLCRVRNVWGIALVISLLIGIAMSGAGTGVTAAQEHPIRVLFMHHSTGQGIIQGGSVREGFTARGYEFWDHGYNEEGLVDAAGNWLGVNWDMPGDNTDPDGWYAIFNQPVTSPPSNTFSHMLEYDVIIFKSCFPSAHIYDDFMWAQYQEYYLSIRDVADQHPDKLFVPFTTPPLVPNETDAAAAARARRWAEYLTSDEYLAGHPNIAVFDIFTHAADAQGFLRAEYRGDEWDSHPNDVANAALGPLLVEFVDQAVRDFIPGEAPPPVDLPDAPDGDQPDAPLDDVSPDAVDAVPDAEGLTTVLRLDNLTMEWWDYINMQETVFACDLVPGEQPGDLVLQMTFDIPIEESAGCGFDLFPAPAWANAQGVSFMVRTDQPDLVLRFALAVLDPANPEPSDAAPFEIELHVTSADWTPVVVAWDDLRKVEWFGDAGADVFDPAQVAWLVFDMGHWELPQAGTIWVDDVRLITE